MGTFRSFRKAYGALKDSTTVGLAKVNSEFKDLDIAVVKATNHVEDPPKERYVRKIIAATSIISPRADVAYCIHALSRRLEKTRNWIVAIKVFIVIHRTLREGDPTFREELMIYSRRAHIFQISHFKDDSSPEAWDCSTWVRAYALYLEERLECYRVLRYDIEAERMNRHAPSVNKVHSKPRNLTLQELLEQLPALQRLLNRLVACHPEGAACTNYLIQYALALVLKESFKIYCTINDTIINLVDMFFDMPKHEAVKALDVYKRAGNQAEYLADFYEFCKGLDLARNFQFPTLKQPPPSFLATMEEYVKEASPNDSVPLRLKYETRVKSSDEEESEKGEQESEKEAEEEAPQPQPKPESPPLISTDDLLGLNDVNPTVTKLGETNALALALIPLEGQNESSKTVTLPDFGTSDWELALVPAAPNPNNAAPSQQTKLEGGFDKLFLDSLYEDENARRQLQMQNAGYGSFGMGTGPMQGSNPFEQQHEPFFMSNNEMNHLTNAQMAMLGQQQQQQQQQQMMMFQQHQQQPALMLQQQSPFMIHQDHHHQHQEQRLPFMIQQQQQQQQSPSMMMMQRQQQQQLPSLSSQSMMMMMSYQEPSPPHMQIPHHQRMGSGTSMRSSNPFGDPFPVYPQNRTTQQGNFGLL